jgi:hypothetical protein
MVNVIAQKEFGVCAPTNAPVWKLRVVAAMETPRSFQRFKAMANTWRANRRSGRPFFKATSDAWNQFYFSGFEQLESDVITNALPQP